MLRVPYVCVRCLVPPDTDQAIKLWDMNTLQCTNTLLGHKSDIWCLQFDAAQQMIVSGSGYEGMSLSLSLPVQTLSRLTVVRVVCVVCCVDRTLKLWDMRTGSCVMTMAGHLGAVNSLCVFYASQSHPHCILSGSADQTIKVRTPVASLSARMRASHRADHIVCRVVSCAVARVSCVVCREPT